MIATLGKNGKGNFKERNRSKDAIIPNAKREIEKEMDVSCHGRIDQESDS